MVAHTSRKMNGRTSYPCASSTLYVWRCMVRALTKCLSAAIARFCLNLAARSSQACSSPSLPGANWGSQDRKDRPCTHDVSQVEAVYCTMAAFQRHRRGLELIADRLEDVGLTWAAIAFAVGLPMLRALLEITLFDWIGRWALNYGKVARDTKEEQQRYKATLDKFKESFWKHLTYLVLFAVAVAINLDGKFITDTASFWRDCTRIPCNAPKPLGHWLLYSLEMGHYMQAIPSLLWWEHRRKDFWEQLGHHVATLLLIIYSYRLNFVRVGAAVFMLHDANDIWMEAAKMARYANDEWTSALLFVTFMVSWFVTRLWYFPSYILHSTLFECLTVARQYNVDPMPHYAIFNALLFFLLGLHIYWSYLILRVAYRQVAHKKMDDVREHDD